MKDFDASPQLAHIIFVGMGFENVITAPHQLKVLIYCTLLYDTVRVALLNAGLIHSIRFHALYPFHWITIPVENRLSSHNNFKLSNLYKGNEMGFQKTILKVGGGQRPEVGKNVTVHCTGYGKNGDLNVKFWSTKDPGQQPFSFVIGLGQVIKGWDEGVMTMVVGEVAKIHCSPDYAYGSGGFPAWGIMPNSELIFEIEVLSVGN